MKITNNSLAIVLALSGIASALPLLVPFLPQHAVEADNTVDAPSKVEVGSKPEVTGLPSVASQPLEAVPARQDPQQRQHCLITCTDPGNCCENCCPSMDVEDGAREVTKRRSRPLRFNPDAQYEMSTVVRQTPEKDTVPPLGSTTRPPGERQFITHESDNEKDCANDDDDWKFKEVPNFSIYDQPPRPHRTSPPQPNPTLVDMNSGRFGAVGKRWAVAEPVSEPEAKRLPAHIVQNKHRSIAEHQPEILGLTGMGEFDYIWENDVPYSNAPAKPEPSSDSESEFDIFTTSAGLIMKRSSLSRPNQPEFYRNNRGRSRANDEKAKDMADFASDRQALGGEVIGWQKEVENDAVLEETMGGPEEAEKCVSCKDMSEKERDKHEMKNQRGGIFEEMRSGNIVVPGAKPIQQEQQLQQLQQAQQVKPQ
ncbi:hypothetical protein DFH27DRAFT_555331 [Peziza echinospora]|nr:hypothetical protein DFH27DRAFT_555331 [Peziza echinospora]